MPFRTLSGSSADLPTPATGVLFPKSLLLLSVCIVLLLLLRITLLPSACFLGTGHVSHRSPRWTSGGGRSVPHAHTRGRMSSGSALRFSARRGSAGDSGSCVVAGVCREVNTWGMGCAEVDARGVEGPRVQEDDEVDAAGLYGDAVDVEATDAREEDMGDGGGGMREGCRAVPPGPEVDVDDALERREVDAIGIGDGAVRTLITELGVWMFGMEADPRGDGGSGIMSRRLTGGRTAFVGEVALRLVPAGNGGLEGAGL